MENPPSPTDHDRLTGKPERVEVEVEPAPGAELGVLGSDPSITAVGPSQTTQSQPLNNKTNPTEPYSSSKASARSADEDAVKLRDENTRLRKLVIHLSELIIRNVIGRK